MTKTKFALSLLLSFCCLPAQAVPPLPGLPRPKQAVCSVNAEAAQERMQAIHKPGTFGASAISATTYQLAVVMIDFSDQPMTKSPAQVAGFYANVKAYYLENSYNLLTVNATLTPAVYRMPQPMSFYARALNSKYDQIARDAIALATAAGFDFSTYNHMMIYHAGEGAETSVSPNSYIWSAYVQPSFLNGPVAGGKTFPGATFVPEKEFFSVDPLGVTCHEYGHQQGLPDLYNTNNFTTQVGTWSLMDGGLYVGNPVGSNPAHLDAWSKQFLGFSVPETISYSAGTSRLLTQAETSRASFIRLPVSVSNAGGANEYFLLEYRRSSGATYDAALPGQGLLIWHIDDSIASNPTRISQNDVNIDPTHRGVGLVPSDGSDPTNGGDSGDPWPGSGVVFAAPKANAYNGKDSGIQVSNISQPGSATIALTLQNPYNNPAITANSTPGGVVITAGAKGYANPDKNENTLIGVRPTSAGTVEINVFSLIGNLIWNNSFAGTANQQTVIPWDGKNSNGEVVSSGIYIVHVNGGGVDLQKKVAVIR